MKEFCTLREIINLMKKLRYMSDNSLEQTYRNVRYAMNSLAEQYQDDAIDYPYLEAYKSMVTREQWRREGYTWHQGYCKCHSLPIWQCPREQT